jgi:ABC-type Mn2+/Zn2+ transport system ATPase subunit
MPSPLGPEPVVRVGSTDLTVAYGDTIALQDVSLTLRGGRLTGIVGPNGSGKTSWIAALTGRVAPARGEVWMHERGHDGAWHPVERRGRIGWVPQHNTVDRDFPLTVRDVVRHGRWSRLRWWQRETEQDRAAVTQALVDTDLESLQHRSLDALSGGQLQRVFVARALAQDARVLLLDEPFAGVDRASEATILRVLRALCLRGDVVVVVHHDLRQAATLFDDVALLSRRCVAFGDAADVLTETHLDEAWGGRLALGTSPLFANTGDVR